MGRPDVPGRRVAAGRVNPGQRQFIRFLLAGAANTLGGYLVFALLLHVVGLSAVLSNVGCYAVGLVVSYALNRAFVFRGRQTTPAAVPLFVACFGAAYGLNLLVLLGLSRGLGAPVLVAQAAAMVTYTVAFFLLSRTFVFREPPALVEAGRRG